VLLQSYNIFHPVQFPTRITETKSSATDNTRINSYDVISISNGLSHPDTHCLVLKNIDNLEKKKVQGIKIRFVNKDSIAQFLNKLSNEKSKNIFKLNDVNEVFNSFLNKYLLVYEP
jgi:hypothetical protein